MSRSFKEFISDVSERTSLYEAFEEGFTPEDIKRGVTEILSPYFKNQEILEKMAVNFLMPDVLEFSKIFNLEVPFSAFKYSHEVHYEALLINEELSLETCAKWLNRINIGLSNILSQFYLEVDKSDLGTYEFLHEILGNIGSLLEGSLKPLLQELLQQSRVVRRKDSSIETIHNLSFGDVINELYQVSGNEDIFAPLDIRINQWRNIAYHHDAQIKNGNIVCNLSDSTKRIFTREELLHLAKELSNIFSGFRLAYYLFLNDNLEKINYMNILPDINLRKEQQALNIISGMASQGFKVIDLIEDDQNFKMIIQDVTNDASDNRRIHTMQFVFSLWNNSPKTKSTIVEYWEKDGTPNFLTIAPIELLKRFEIGELTLQNTIEQLELYDLKNNIKIP